jgi:WD40 repeat protein/beta-lactamase regulating signal transducer with metallopeptidase domain
MKSPEAVLVGVALVHVTLISLLGMLAWLAGWRRGPALRGGILLASLIGLLVVLPLATVAPVWLPLPEGVCLAATEADPSDHGSGSPALFLPIPLSSAASSSSHVQTSANPTAVLTAAAEPMAETVVPPRQAGQATHVPPFGPIEAETEGPATEPTGRFWTLATVLTAAWLIVALACLGRTLWRLTRLHCCARSARQVQDVDWTRCVASLARRLGQGAVPLLESPMVTSPLTLGFLRPVILLPLDRRTWSPEQRALIIAHELAHVRRRDFLAGLLAEFAACMYWFHPLVRWLARRLRLEQEYSADSWVASVAVDSSDYVRCLARLALQFGRGRGSLAPALWHRRPEILRRIDMLRRNPHGQPCRLAPKTVWTLTAMATAACLTIAGVGPLNPAAAVPNQVQAGTVAKATAGADQHGDPLPAGALARLGTTRLRHGAEITFVAFAAQGKTLLTAGRDNTVRLWDLSTGKEIRNFPGSPAAVTRDGKTLAAVGATGIQLWDIDTGKKLVQIPKPAPRVTSLLFAPDGLTLAARARNGTLFLWAAESGQEIRQIKQAPRPKGNAIAIAFGGGDPDPPGMAFTPDGKVLAAAATDYKKDSASHSVKLWEVATGKEIRKVQAPNEVRVSAVAVAPDGKLLAFGGGGVVRLCAIDTGTELRKLKAPDGGILALAFSPEGKTLVARGRNLRVRLWETETGKELRQVSDVEPVRRTGGAFLFVPDNFSAPEARVLALSPDGKHIATATGSTVRLWEMATGNELPLLGGHRRPPSSVAHLSDGKVASWGVDQVIRIWERASGRSLGQFRAPPRTTLAAFAADGRTIALANADKTIRLHDTITGKELQKLRVHTGSVGGLAFAPGGKVLAVRGGDNTIRLYDLARGTEVRQMHLGPAKKPSPNNVLIFGGGSPGPARGPGLAFSPNGRLLVAPGPGGSPGNTLLIFDVATGKELRKIESSRPIASFAWSPDGRVLAAQNADRTITLWEAASAREQASLGKPSTQRQQPNPGMVVNVVIDGMPVSNTEPAGPVGLAISPEGRIVAAAGPDQAVVIWDIATGTEIGRLTGHKGRVETVAFAPSGKSLASGATDTTILLWDMAGPRKQLATQQPAKLSGAEAEALWVDLAGADAARARQGIIKLTGASQQAVAFLAERLKPTAAVDPRKIAGWVADLNSEKFAVRETASSNLVKAGEQAVPALQKILASPPSLETHNRADALLRRVTSGTLTPEQLRHVRTVEVLERIASPQAQRLLQDLAKGATGALLTVEAQAALLRLDTTSTSRP